MTGPVGETVGDRSPAPHGARWRSEARAFVELLALNGLAIAQPVLDVFGRAPEHLIFRGAERGDIIAFGLIVTFAVPVGVWLLEMLVGLVSTRLRTALHIAVLWSAAAIVATLIADARLPRILALVVGGLVATGFVLLHHRTRGPRIWLGFLAPAPIVFLALFLLASPIAPLLRSPVSAIGTPVRDPTRTVVVVFDELSLPQLLDVDGDIDADLFPNFARLAETSHWFRQATTVANTTDVVVPSMLTGVLPSGRTTPSHHSHPDNLFSLVGGAVPIVAVESITRLCPDSVCEQVTDTSGGLRNLLDDARRVIGHRLDPTDPELDPMATMVDDRVEADLGTDVPEEPGEEERAESLEAWVDGGAGRFERFVGAIDDSPGLHFLHVLLPHGPFRFLPDGTRYHPEKVAIGRSIDVWHDDPVPVAHVRQRHLLQLQRTDALLGRLLDQLRADGRWDDTNLVVLSDHGIAFEPGETLRAIHMDSGDDPTALAQILWVPFFVKTAGQTEGVVSDDPIRTVDLAPTVADLLGVDIPWDHDGRSALAGGSGDPDLVVMQVNAPDERDTPSDSYHRLDRALGWERVLDSTTGAFAPSVPGVTASDRIHRIGPRPDLWGEPLPSSAERIEVEIDEASRADEVDPTSGRVPALFRAVTEHAAPGTPVAVTVDGIVWATTVVHDDGGTSRIDAILPARAFRSGANELAVHHLG